MLASHARSYVAVESEHNRPFRRLDDLGPSMQQALPWLRTVASLLVPTYLVCIFGAPAACIVTASSASGFGAFCLVMATPFAFLAAACALSLPHRRFVVEGRMPVDTAIPAYFHRRLYGLCWTTVFYSGPVYHLVLSLPWLRRAVFRGFGYRGSMDFTVYPDTWIRDLPMLDFGAGCYLSNKATIGTNMIFMREGRKWIEVGHILVGAGAMIGHMTVIGPGTELGDRAQIGVVCGIGRRVRVGADAVVWDATILDHGCCVEAAAQVRSRCYVGKGRRISKGDAGEPGSAHLRNAAS